MVGWFQHGRAHGWLLGWRVGWLVGPSKPASQYVRWGFQGILFGFFCLFGRTTGVLTSIAAIMAFWLLVTPSATPPNVLMSSEAGPCPTSCPRMNAANMYIGQIPDSPLCGKYRSLAQPKLFVWLGIGRLSPSTILRLPVPFQHGRPGLSACQPPPGGPTPSSLPPSARCTGILFVSFVLFLLFGKRASRLLPAEFLERSKGSFGRRHPQPPARWVAI